MNIKPTENENETGPTAKKRESLDVFWRFAPSYTDEAQEWAMPLLMPVLVEVLKANEPDTAAFLGQPMLTTMVVVNSGIHASKDGEHELLVFGAWKRGRKIPMSACAYVGPPAFIKERMAEIEVWAKQKGGQTYDVLKN